MGAAVKAYFCPSRGSPRVFNGAASWYGPSGTYAHAQNDYAGSNLDNTGAIISHNPGDANMISLAAISDGTSNTMLAGEKRVNRTALGCSRATTTRATAPAGTTT